MGVRLPAPRAVRTHRAGDVRRHRQTRPARHEHRGPLHRTLGPAEEAEAKAAEDQRGEDAKLEAGQVLTRAPARPAAERDEGFRPPRIGPTAGIEAKRLGEYGAVAM